MNIRFASIGDCCADMYSDRTVLGGTAYNVATAAKKAGAKASIISAIGTDKIGKRFLESFNKNNIDTSCLSVINKPTDSIEIRLDHYGKPHYSNWKTAAIETVYLHHRKLSSFDITRCVLFTSTEKLFQEFCRLKLEKTVKVGDFAGTSAHSFEINIIEQYAKNLDVIIKSVENKENLSFLQVIAQKYGCMVLCLLGSHGSIAFSKDNVHEEPAVRIQTKNTTGAGDVYQAHFLVEYVQSKNIPLAMKKATEAAAEAIR